MSGKYWWNIGEGYFPASKEERKAAEIIADIEAWKPEDGDFRAKVWHVVAKAYDRPIMQCVHCGKSWLHLQYRTGKYCSHRCRVAYCRALKKSARAPA